MENLSGHVFLQKQIMKRAFLCEYYYEKDQDYSEALTTLSPSGGCSHCISVYYDQMLDQKSHICFSIYTLTLTDVFLYLQLHCSMVP